MRLFFFGSMSNVSNEDIDEKRLMSLYIKGE